MKKSALELVVNIRVMLDNSTLKLLECKRKKILFTKLVLPVGSPDLAFLGVRVLRNMVHEEKIIILTLL